MNMNVAVSDLDLIEGRVFQIQPDVKVAVPPRLFRPTRKRVDSRGCNVYLFRPSDVAWIRAAWGSTSLQGDTVGGGPGAEPYCRSCGEPIKGDKALVYCRMRFAMKRNPIRAFIHAHPEDCTPCTT